MAEDLDLLLLSLLYLLMQVGAERWDEKDSKGGQQSVVPDLERSIRLGQVLLKVGTIFGPGLKKGFVVFVSFISTFFFEKK